MSLGQHLYQIKIEAESITLKEVKTSNTAFLSFAEIDSHIFLNGKPAIKLNNGEIVFVECDNTQLSALIKKISKKKKERKCRLIF